MLLSVIGVRGSEEASHWEKDREASLDEFRVPVHEASSSEQLSGTWM